MFKHLNTANLYIGRRSDSAGPDKEVDIDSSDMHLLRLLEIPNNLLEDCTAPAAMHQTCRQNLPSSLRRPRASITFQYFISLLALTLPYSGEIMQLPRPGAPQTAKHTCGETIHPTTA